MRLDYRRATIPYRPEIRYSHKWRRKQALQTRHSQELGITVVNAKGKRVGLRMCVMEPLMKSCVLQNEGRS